MRALEVVGRSTKTKQQTAPTKHNNNQDTNDSSTKFTKIACLLLIISLCSILFQADEIKAILYGTNQKSTTNNLRPTNIQSNLHSSDHPTSNMIKQEREYWKNIIQQDDSKKKDKINTNTKSTTTTIKVDSNSNPTPNESIRPPTTSNPVNNDVIQKDDEASKIKSKKITYTYDKPIYTCQLHSQGPSYKELELGASYQTKQECIEECNFIAACTRFDYVPTDPKAICRYFAKNSGGEYNKIKSEGAAREWSTVVKILIFLFPLPS